MPSPVTPLFTTHDRLWRDNRYVYPVISRRAKGLSIGVNLNPDMACNFDCVYCSVDRSAPATVHTVDLAVVRAELDALLVLAVGGGIWAVPPFDRTPPELRRLNDIAFSGDGEPTAAAEFPAACRLADELLRWHGAAAKIVVITNATLLQRPETVAALNFLDGVPSEIWAKLDAGTEDHYQRVDRSKVPLARVLDNLLAAGRQRPIVIQSLFMRLDGAGPAPAAKIVVITNATLLQRPETVAALKFLDGVPSEIWAKLDAGTEDHYQRVDRSKVPLARVLDNLLAAGRQRPIVIQSLFMRLDGVGPAPAEIAAYCMRLKGLVDQGCRIRLVQVYTTARATAESFVTPLPAAEVDAIAQGVRALGITAEAYYGPG